MKSNEWMGSTYIQFRYHGRHETHVQKGGLLKLQSSFLYFFIRPYCFQLTLYLQHAESKVQYKSDNSGIIHRRERKLKMASAQPV